MSKMLRTFIPLLLLCGIAFAQPSGGPATQAVIAFMNVLDHEAVIERESTHGSHSAKLALTLLDHLDAQGILAPDLSAAIRSSIPGATVDRGTFILFLFDLLNHTASLDTLDVSELEASLSTTYCGLDVPAGSTPDGATDPVLYSNHVSTVVRGFIDSLDCIIPKLRDTYGEPVE